MRSFYFRMALLLGALGEAAVPAAAQLPKPRSRPAAAPRPYQALDARMQQVPDSSTRTVAALARFINAAFATETERARAAFGWVARNVRYDEGKQYALTDEGAPAAVAQATLARRRGVCRHYAELYCALANQVGVPTYVVTGYVSLKTAPGHAWCVSCLAGRWVVMEPTWAPVVLRGPRPSVALHEEYFAMSPRAAIEAHMPFDPLWQLLAAPRTPEQFQAGTGPVARQPAFAVADSIALYARQDTSQRLRAAIRRITQNGVRNDLTYNHLMYLRGQESNLRITADNAYIQRYNEALHEFNQGVAQLNAFVEFFNRQFQPRQPDAELQLLLPPVAAHFERARALLAPVGARPATQALAQDMAIPLQQAEARLRNCQDFMARYLRTGKLLRPTLFLAISNLGGHHEMTR